MGGTGKLLMPHAAHDASSTLQYALGGGGGTEEPLILTGWGAPWMTAAKRSWSPQSLQCGEMTITLGLGITLQRCHS